MDLCLVYGHETTQKLLCIALKQRQTLLLSGLTVALVVRSEKTWHPSRRQLSHAQYFMQDMTHAVFWDACCLGDLAHLQSAVYQYEIVDFFHVILHGIRFRCIWAWLIKNRRATTLKLVKPIFDGRQRRRSVTAYSIQALIDCAARYPFQKQESNHRPLLVLFHFCKIRGHARFHTRSKQNYESNSTEILTVGVYENVPHDSTIVR